MTGFRTAPASRAASAAGILVFALCGSLALVDIFRGHWDHDGGYYLLQSALIAQGLRPFLDYTTLYPPGFGLIHALPVLLGIDRWLLVWLVPLVWIVLTGLLTRLYWARIRPDSHPLIGWTLGAAFALFCIDFGGNHVTLELGIAFFGVAALVAFARTRGPDYLLVGACVGAAVLVKQPGVLLLLPFLTQCRSRGEAIRLLAGVCVPLLLCLAWLEFDVGRILQSHDALQGYLQQRTAPTMIGLAKRFARVLLQDVLRRPPGIVLFAAVGLLTAGSLYRAVRRREARRVAWLVSWSLVGLAYLGARAVNNFPHYTLNVWPAVVALLGATVPVLHARTVRGVAAAAALGTVLVFVLFPGRQHEIEGRPYFMRWRNPGQLETALKPVSDELRRLLPDRMTVTQLGMEESVLFFLAGRLPMNIDWAGYDLASPIRGDAIVFTDYRQRTAAQRRQQIEQAGYVADRSWTSRWGTIELYRRPEVGIDP